MIPASNQHAARVNKQSNGSNHYRQAKAVMLIISVDGRGHSPVGPQVYYTPVLICHSNTHRNLRTPSNNLTALLCSGIKHWSDLQPALLLVAPQRFICNYIHRLIYTQGIHTRFIDIYHICAPGKPYCRIRKRLQAYTYMHPQVYMSNKITVSAQLLTQLRISYNTPSNLWLRCAPTHLCTGLSPRFPVHGC